MQFPEFFMNIMYGKPSLPVVYLCKLLYLKKWHGGKYPVKHKKPRLCDRAFVLITIMMA